MRPGSVFGEYEPFRWMNLPQWCGMSQTPSLFGQQGTVGFRNMVYLRLCCGQCWELVKGLIITCATDHGNKGSEEDIHLYSS